MLKAEKSLVFTKLLSFYALRPARLERTGPFISQFYILTSAYFLYFDIFILLHHRYRYLLTGSGFCIVVLLTAYGLMSSGAGPFVRDATGARRLPFSARPVAVSSMAFYTHPARTFLSLDRF